MSSQPAPFWTPSSQQLNSSQMSLFMNFVNEKLGKKFQSYWELHDWSVNDIGQFWSLLGEFTKVVWQTEPQESFVPSPTSMRDCQWFKGGTLNFAQNLLAQAPAEACLISVAEGRDDLVLSRHQLETSVRKLAAFLREHGIKKGDRVVAIVPNTEPAIIGMLAASSLGAVWASCSPDFGAQGIVDRFGQISPKLLMATTSYQYGGKDISCLEVLAEAVGQLGSLEHLVLVNHLRNQESNCQWPVTVSRWEDILNTQDPESLEFQAMSFSDPLYIMFSSGTTGVPKCIVHGVGGTLLQHKKELQLHANLGKGSRLLYFTTCGWMMWNWMASALSVGAGIVLYEGSPGYPHISRLWEVVQKHGVTVFGTSPKFLGACQKQDYQPQQHLDLSSLELLLSTGAPLLPEQFDWIQTHVSESLQVASISGGTDIISCFMLGVPILPVYRGEIQAPGLAMAVQCWVDGVAQKNQKGELVCVRPFPSMPLGFWNDPEGQKYEAAYFGYYQHADVWRHGDYISIGDTGGITVFGRSDATLNPGGVRIGTAEIYRVVENFDFVSDSLAVGVRWDGDTQIILFVTVVGDWQEEQGSQLKAAIKQQLTPRHVPSKIFAVKEIPYTRSGKKLEIAATRALHGESVPNLSAVANPDALKEYSKIGQNLLGDLAST